jgi:hypothetical protein
MELKVVLLIYMPGESTTPLHQCQASLDLITYCLVQNAMILYWPGYSISSCLEIALTA